MHDGFGKMLPVVNKKDQELGLEFRKDIHRLGLMHRTAHILVFNGRGGLYLQKRSARKDTYPNRWTSSASGHVEAGESYLNAAYRELYEELDLVLPCRFLGILRPQPATDHAFAAVYATQTRLTPHPNPEEISMGRFFSRRQAWELVRESDLVVPVLKLVLALASRRGAPFSF